MCLERGSTSSSCSRTRCFWSPASTFIGAVRIHVFLKFDYRLILKHNKAPDPFGGLGEIAHGVAACYTRSAAFISSVPEKFPFHGAAGHNRWEVVETLLPVKTQGRNMDRSLSTCALSTCALCCRVSFDGFSPRRGRPSSGVRWSSCQDGHYPSPSDASKRRDRGESKRGAASEANPTPDAVG